MTKQWQQPKLVVLVRGEATEAVLAACKTGYGAGGSPNDGAHGCLNVTSCVQCSAQANS